MKISNKCGWIQLYFKISFVLFLFATRLNLPSLQEPINDYYITLLMEFGKELEVTMRCYQKQKNDPPIGRNMPPIAGKHFLFSVLERIIIVPIFLPQRFSLLFSFFLFFHHPFVSLLDLHLNSLILLFPSPLLFLVFVFLYHFPLWNFTL